MFKRALSDGKVWLAVGMVCFALFFALEHWAGTSSTIEFIRGFLIGLSVVGFAGAAVMLILEHGQPPQKPAARPAPSKKSRR
jgi:hypothetical protein